LSLICDSTLPWGFVFDPSAVRSTHYDPASPSSLEKQNRKDGQESDTCNQSKHGKFVGHFVPLAKSGH